MSVFQRAVLGQTPSKAVAYAEPIRIRDKTGRINSLKKYKIAQTAFYCHSGFVSVLKKIVPRAPGLKLSLNSL